MIHLRLSTKILLLTLLIALGTAGAVSWIVTFHVTRQETDRAGRDISAAIDSYALQLRSRRKQIDHVVRALLEAPVPRSYLQAADAADPAAREQLREILGRDVHAELQSGQETPAFHVLVNQGGEVLLAVAPGDEKLSAALAMEAMHWPVIAVIGAKEESPPQYVATKAGLFLVMGVPLRAQLTEEPTHAYFIGFRVDNQWVRRQLLEPRATGAALMGWFVVDGAVMAHGSSNEMDQRPALLTPKLAMSPQCSGERVDFALGEERFLGRAFDLNLSDARAGRLILASSMDEALVDLHRLQSRIWLTTLAACCVAVLGCRSLATMIGRPIDRLVAGTRRIAAGQFDQPVELSNRDELGTLAESFNQMARGLQERDNLRDQRLKTERDLALARKIQMDVLPHAIPTCSGYDMAAMAQPAEQTGGDIYDIAPTTSGSIALLLADATGHGVGPALSVTQVRSMLRLGLRLEGGLEQIIDQINRQVCQDLGAERFVTAFFGILDPARHVISYQSAGQGPLLHFHASENRFEWLGASMLPLGVLDEPLSEGAQEMLLMHGDLVVLLTDGFFEYANVPGEQFGKERVAEVIRRESHRPAADILDAIRTAVAEFAGDAPQLDDMTALVVRRN